MCCNDIKFNFVQQGKIAKFSGSDVVINCDLLHNHLSSSKSKFAVHSLLDFIESLHILGFFRFNFPEKQETKYLCYRFTHQKFNPNEPASDDLYKQPEKVKCMKGVKRMLSGRSYQLLQNLMHHKFEMKTMELTHMRLTFALQTRLNQLRDFYGSTEFVTDKPDYMKNEEIAGYYGKATLEDLQACFQDRFPIYQDVPEEPEIDDMQVIVEHEPLIATELIKIEEPLKKKRRYNTSTKAKLAKLEVTQALKSLHMEENMKSKTDE